MTQTALSVVYLILLKMDTMHALDPKMLSLLSIEWNWIRLDDKTAHIGLPEGEGVLGWGLGVVGVGLSV